MKTVLAVFLVFASIAQAETIHITGVEDHIRTKDEPSFSAVLHSKRITGTIGHLKYSLEEAALMAYHFEVGKDYPVLKITDKQIKIQVTDKKGREQTETLQVKAVQEVESQ